jgi:hypothetical protein
VLAQVLCDGLPLLVRVPVKAERVEQVIADDVAFLTAHPTRRSNSAAMAKARELLLLRERDQ